MAMSKKNRQQAWRSKFVWKDGDRLAVLRPDDPELSISEAKRIQSESEAGTLSPEEMERQFSAILQKQRFTYVGILGTKDAEVLDDDGKKIGKCEPGDSFIPLGQAIALHAAANEGKG